MLKRIRYISEFNRSMTPADIDALVRAAARSNEEQGVTGVLMATGDLFFQIVEGPVESIDALWGRLQADPRHREVLLLHSEQGDLVRQFPDWAMRKVDISHTATAQHEPLRAILKAIHVQSRLVQNLAGALEQAIWRELRDLDDD